MIDFIVLLRELSRLLGIQSLSYRLIVIYSFGIILVVFILIVLKAYLETTQRIYKYNRQYFLLKKLVLSFIIAFGLLMFEILSRVIVFGIDIGEQTSDTLMILRTGHWKYSLKNPYYDLINVPALMRSILGLVMNCKVAHSFKIAALFSFIIGMLMLITYYLLIKKVFNTDYIIYYVLTMQVLIANPYSSLISNYMGLSFVLTLLSVYLVLFQKNKIAIIISLLLYIGAMLIHGTAILTIMILILFYIFVKIGNLRKVYYYRNFISFSVLAAILISILRFLYTSAYRGTISYFRELLIFIFGEISYPRIVKWSSPVVPRITALAYVVLPALAIAPVLSYFLLRFFKSIFRWKRNTYISRMDSFKWTIYLSFLVLASLLILVAFLSTVFSNSLSREFGYPGIMLLAIPATYTIYLLQKSRSRSKYTLYVLIILVVILGFSTPSKIPWYNDYRSLTVYWRSASIKYYLIAKSIANYYEIHEKLIIIAKDKLPMDYAYISLKWQLLPKSKIELLNNNFINIMDKIKNYNMIYSAGLVQVHIRS